jgi:hydroxymethylbilane synthase
METIRLIGRSSRLSLLQIDIVKEKIRSLFPEIQLEVIARTSQGDQLQEVPLHTVEGMDFFTADIFRSLKSGEADIAVHSLKDMSSEHFFGGNKFAVVDRDDTRDVAIFNPSVIDKLRRAETIVVGTCSPRREEMATVFLKKALPQLGKEVSVITKPIRGNVETRLRKLDQGDYDATILAAAGLNRLLKSQTDRQLISGLLNGKRLMALPLVECVPAPCQGAVVAEAWPENKLAVEILDRINDKKWMDDCIEEKKAGAQYGVGCLQRFGVTTLDYDGGSTIYAAGRDRHENNFSKWYTMPELDMASKKMFSTTEHMGSFFEYEYKDAAIALDAAVVYVSNYKAVQQEGLIRLLENRRVWASGTKTWFELAAKGIWVEGSADAFGLKFLERAWAMPLFGIRRDQVMIITNEDGAANWNRKGWKAVSTYGTITRRRQELEDALRGADIVFWTSFRQFELYRDVLKEKVQHVCPSGETAALFEGANLNPVVFPNIKAFQQWTKTFTRSRNEG